MLLFKHCCVLMLLLVSARAQSFEVASVKINESGDPGGSMRTTPGGRLEAVNSTLQAMARYAYNVRDYQIESAPQWFDSARFDVAAKAPGSATTPEFRAMMQKLLEERFALVLHRETRQLPVHILTIAKSGVRMTERSPGDSSVASGSGEIRGQRITMTMLANQLAAALGRPVQDRTGLTGKYDVTLQWAPDSSAETDTRPSIFAAVQEQLGLRLDTGKGPVEVLVIDSASRTPRGN